MPKAFIDTNIFIYAAGRPSKFQEPCQRLLRQIDSEKITLITNTEVLQEILYSFQKRKQIATGVEITEKIVATQIPVFPIQARDLRFAARLLSKHPTVSVRDCIHTATMHFFDIEYIYSYDKDFDLIPGIVRKEPK